MASKKKKVKKGFTLVEVIASILILGIIALVVVPIVRKNLDEVRMKTYKETVNEIIRTGKIYASKNSLPGKLEDPIVFICNGESCINENGDKLNFKGEIPVSGYITIDGLNDVRADYVFNGQFCANGIRGKLDVAKSCNEIDTTIPKVVSITQNKRVFTIKLRDNESGIGAYCITTTNNSDSCTWQDTTETTVEKTLTTSGKYYVFAKDKKDNISKSKSFTTGDIEDPTSPTSGSIGIVSGANTTGTIQNPVTGSTDESGITYKYLVTNTNTKPNKNDQNFTTSLDFERTCGTLYYGWAVAEDSNGYRSEVYSLGSTQDGTDSYSEWTTCTKTCGTGTQERTNSCQLVTEELSQNCNTQTCCSSTTYQDTNGTWGACSKTCGSGTQSYTVTRTYYSSYDGSYCSQSTGVVTSSRACNTQACCAYAVNKYWDYNYTGGVQSFTVPCKGTYQLQVYGAQGGATSKSAGAGGYAVGNVTLNANTVLYIVVGGKGGSAYGVASGGYNGGGNSSGNSDDTRYRGGGGGATHIGKTNALLRNTAVGNLYIAAGGGGGAGEDAAGGAGGGTTGGAGGLGSGVYGGGAGGAQSGSLYGYGQGGVSVLGGGGGGAGYYGGGAGNHYAGGGGGSGYIGGVTGGSMSNGQRSGNGFARITLKSISN